MQLVVSSTLITLLLTPMLAGNAMPIATAIDRVVRPVLPQIGRAPTDAGDEPHHEHRNHVVVVGYGPAGRGVVGALRNTQHEVIVIDLNPRLAAIARATNVHAIIGNAAQREMLEHAHLATARALVITLPDHQSACDVIHQARHVAPKIRIIARARYHAFVNVLRSSGADVVVDEEQTVAGYLGAEIFQEVSNDFESS
jgi:CPA2 family monovalent cation:H+ antiporter-2